VAEFFSEITCQAYALVVFWVIQNRFNLLLNCGLWPFVLSMQLKRC